MSKVRLVSGRINGATITKLLPKPFPARCSGRCRICERVFVRGDLISAKKKQQPVHADCATWQFKERNNPRSPFGGYDVPPGRGRLSEESQKQRVIARRNRQIDKTAQFGRKTS